MHKIETTVRIGIANGPEIKEIVSTNVDAYDEIVFKLEPTKKKKVKVQPGTPDELLFVLIKSSLYSDKEDTNKQILYTAKPNQNPDINLDKTHFYQGAGGISSLGDAPTTFTFENKFPQPAGTTDGEDTNIAEIEILVGRTAVQEVTT